MYADKYQEHIAHSQNDGSQWDGFDRGDLGNDCQVSQGQATIGRMPAIGGGKVVIQWAWYDYDEIFCVFVRDDLKKTFNTAAEAKAYARNFVAKH